jgi:hypothetical protein
MERHLHQLPKSGADAIASNSSWGVAISRNNAGISISGVAVSHSSAVRRDRGLRVVIVPQIYADTVRAELKRLLNTRQLDGGMGEEALRRTA